MTLRQRALLRWLAPGLALLAACIPIVALAHPLGNFTVNRYSGLQVAGNQLRVHYVLDMAEIPALQEKQKIGAGEQYADNDAYRRARVTDLASALRLEVDGTVRKLKVVDSALMFPPGQAGLTTLRIEILLTIDAGQLQPHTVRFRDGNYSGRLGWSEVTVSTSGEAQVHDSDAPTHSISNELRAYPQDRLASPLSVTSASFTYIPGASSANLPSFLNPATGGFRVIQDQYASLIAQDLTPAVILLSLVLAVALGAAHALSPGHGKAVMAGYLVGTRRSPRHAVILGLTITVTHTVGVFALGLITLFASALISPERLYPYLTLASGILVVALGLTLVVARARLALAGAEGGEEHHHDRAPDAEQPHSHGLTTHTHAPPAGTGTRSLLAMGIAGGMIPCPSALIVLLSAIALHRVVLGLILIVAFSIGLAGVLTGIGVALATGLPVMSRLARARRLGAGLRLLRYASLAGAVVLTIAGMGLTLQALPQVL